MAASIVVGRAKASRTSTNAVAAAPSGISLPRHATARTPSLQRRLTYSETCHASPGSTSPLRGGRKVVYQRSPRLTSEVERVGGLHARDQYANRTGGSDALAA